MTALTPLKALIYSNAFVAVCASTLVWVTYAQLQLTDPFRLDPMFGLVCFATLFVYNVDRIFGFSPEDRHQRSERHEWLLRHQNVVRALTALSAIAMITCGLLLPLHIFLVLIPMGAVSVAYGLPWIRWSGRWLRLKDIPGLKIVLIAVVWSLATSTLPIAYQQEQWLNTMTLHLFLQRALFIFAITLPFDVRDWEKDRTAGILTLPHILGLQGTRVVATLAMVMMLIDVWWIHKSQPLFWGLALSAGITTALLSRMSRQRGELYYAGWMDGTMLIQWLCVWISQRIP